MFGKIIQRETLKEVKAMDLEDFLRFKYGDDREKRKKIFINYLVKDLYKGVTADDIVQLKADGVYIEGRKMTREEIDFTRAAADNFRNSFLWKRIMKDRVKYVANLRMFEKSVSDADMIFGKAMLYDLEILDKLLVALSKLK